MDSAFRTKWFLDREGQRVPFDPDRIRQSVFEATRSLGTPDAFLAQELTEAILHFGDPDWADHAPTGQQVRELAVKVVRELGHPRLARVLEDRPASAKLGVVSSQTFSYRQGQPLADLEKQLRDHVNLQEVFSPDLAQAHHEGWLVLGPGWPDCAEAGVVEGVPGVTLAETWRKLRVHGRGVRPLLAFDGLDWWPSDSAARQTIEWFTDLVGWSGPHVVVNLNSVEPPRWIVGDTPGPLFAAASSQRRADPEVRQVLLDTFAGKERCRVDWHVDTTHDVPVSDAALGHVLLGHDLAFCFDRPRRPIPLGEGLDRDHDLVLLSVGLHLPKFLELPAIDSQIDRFLAKLPALARMAVSAGLRKRAYLRRDLREPGLAQGFRLERARLVIVPIGIDDVVRQFLGESCVASPRSNDLALRILGILRDTLQVAGDRSALNVALDDAVEIFQGSPQLATGLSCPDPRFPLARQLETVADWHDRTGTATLTFPENFRGGIEELREVVRIATKRTTLVRLRFRRPSAFPEAK